eukprot:5907008-Pleurochrysis_carterae.AAC.3
MRVSHLCVRRWQLACAASPAAASSHRALATNRRCLRLACSKRRSPDQVRALARCCQAMRCGALSDDVGLGCRASCCCSVVLLLASCDDRLSCRVLSVAVCSPCRSLSLGLVVCRISPTTAHASLVYLRLRT